MSPGAQTDACISKNNLRTRQKLPAFREVALLLPGVLCLSFSGMFSVLFVVFPFLSSVPRRCILQSLGAWVYFRVALILSVPV